MYNVHVVINMYNVHVVINMYIYICKIRYRALPGIYENRPTAPPPHTDLQCVDRLVRLVIRQARLVDRFDRQVRHVDRAQVRFNDRVDGTQVRFVDRFDRPGPIVLTASLSDCSFTNFPFFRLFLVRNHFVRLVLSRIVISKLVFFVICTFQNSPFPLLFF